MKKFIFTIIALGMAAGCTPEPPPIEILSIDLFPTSGSTSISTCTAEFYAVGTGRIEVKWDNRYDPTGWHRIASKFLYIDDEGTYEAVLDLAPEYLEYYYQVIICDSAGTELAKSNEVFYGDGPTGPPVFTFSADPTEGYAPLTIHFWVDYPYSTQDDKWTWDPEGTGNYISFQPWGGDSWCYEEPGIYTVSIRCVNRWGPGTVTIPDMIEVWE